MGRLSDYCEKLAADICSRLADGESLKAICSGEDMPDKSTVYRWLAANDVFRDMYARAREDQADTLADEIVTIADECVIGEKVETDKDGNVVKTVTGDMIERSRLRVDARKWVAAKLKPRKYGDRIQHANDPENPMPGRSDEEVDARIRELLSKESG